MRADVTRRTFDPEKHYRAVVHEQGRMLLDADLDEQQRIAAHRVETGAADLVGGCGGPIGAAGFAITPAGRDLRISAGRYYVDGILVDNPQPVLFSEQPDHPGAQWPPPTGDGRYHLVLDVWSRLVTALDDPAIRDVALGGPTTAARERTVWQVRALPAADGDSCLTQVPDPGGTTGLLAARAVPETGGDDPCQVPPGAGFTGLENQLYRVEVHAGGDDYDLTDAPDVHTVTGFPAGTTDQLTVAGADDLAAGDAVEVYRAAAGHDPLVGQLVHVVDVDRGTVTVDSDLDSFTLDDAPRVRKVSATFVWSRDNGSVVTSVERLNGVEVTVADLGPDAVRGFAPGQWVEITDDRDEPAGRPGRLRRIDSIDQARRVVVLKTPAQPLPGAPADPGVDPAQHPKLRRWDGAGAVRRRNPAPGEDWTLLEDGVQVRFTAGHYRTGDFWNVVARTANIDAGSGTIEWPQDAGEPALRGPHGVVHHTCRLAIVEVAGAGSDDDDDQDGKSAVLDCRHEFPAVTALTNLHHVGGDGQQGVPDPSDPGSRSVDLPAELQVRVANGAYPVAGAQVRFAITPASNGRLQGTARKTAEVLTDANGLAGCRWQLDGSSPVQVCEARLLNAAGSVIGHQVVRFTATLSTADRVSYDPGRCERLSAAGVRTVQQAIDQLCQGGGGADSPRIVDMSWPHAGQVDVQDLARNGLALIIDRPLQRPADPPVGWFRVNVEYDRRRFEADPNELFHSYINPEKVVFDGQKITWVPFSSLADALNNLDDFPPEEVLCRVVVKSNVLLDHQGEPLDGDFLRATLPTGDGVPGGDFESWFTLVLRR